MVNVPPCMSSMLERAVARLAAELGDLPLDAGERQPVRLAHHRNDQTLVGADGDADVVVVLVDDVLAVDLGVDRRDFLERLDHRFHEESHEAQLHAVLLLEALLVLRSAGPSPGACRLR